MVERVNLQILFTRVVQCDQYFQILFAHLRLLYPLYPHPRESPRGRLTGRDLSQIVKRITAAPLKLPLLESLFEAYR